MTDEKIERSFVTSLPARLKISNIRGSVTIRPVEGEQITVKAVKDLSSGDVDNTEIKIDQGEDGTVRVETDYRHHYLLWNRQPCRVHYTIEAPQQCFLTLEVVAADADVDGLQGAVRMHAVSGNIHTRNLTGHLDLRTVSGNVVGDNLQGPLDLDTVSGNVDLINCTLDSVHGKTVSGDVIAKFQPGQGPFEFRSVSGNVSLSLPAGVGCSASLNTQSGNLRSNSAGSTKEWRRGNYQAEYFGGGRRLTLRSVSGDLDLQFVDEVGASVPVDASTSGPSANVSEILEKIENGELSVDDALKLLDK